MIGWVLAETKVPKNQHTRFRTISSTRTVCTFPINRQKWRSACVDMNTKFEQACRLKIRGCTEKIDSFLGQPIHIELGEDKQNDTTVNIAKFQNKKIPGL